MELDYVYNKQFTHVLQEEDAVGICGTRIDDSSYKVSKTYRPVTCPRCLQIINIVSLHHAYKLFAMTGENRREENLSQ
jgi:hypothetical protein